MIVCCEMKLSEHRSLLPTPTRQSPAKWWKRSLDNHPSYLLPCEPESSNHHSSIQLLEQQLWILDDSNVPCGRGIDDSNSISRYDRDLWWLSIAKNSISSLCRARQTYRTTSSDTEQCEQLQQFAANRSATDLNRIVSHIDENSFVCLSPWRCAVGQGFEQDRRRYIISKHGNDPAEL